MVEEHSEKSRIPWEKWAAITVVCLGAALAVWFFFRFLFGILLPFLLGAVAVALLRPLSEKLRGKTRLPGALVSLLGVLCVGGALAILFGFAAYRLFAEGSALLLRVSEEGFAARLEEAVGELLSRFPLLAESLGEGEGMGALFLAAVRRLGEALPGILASAVTSVPNAIFSVFVFLFSAFYFAVDGERMRGTLVPLLPPSLRGRLEALEARAAKTAVSYFKVYAILSFITFSLLLLGFWILSVDYAFLLAAVLAVFDLLPLFGVGAVLLPAGAILLFVDRPMGVGLLLLYGVILFVRQVLEPRLIGKRLGLHPLPVLLLLYGGSRLFGLWGLFLAPPLAVLFSALFTARQEKSPTS